LTKSFRSPNPQNKNKNKIVTWLTHLKRNTDVTIAMPINAVLELDALAWIIAARPGGDHTLTLLNNGHAWHGIGHCQLSLSLSQSRNSAWRAGSTERPRQDLLRSPARLPAHGGSASGGDGGWRVSRPAASETAAGEYAEMRRRRGSWARGPRRGR
jgi:hypothetical protein